MTTTDSRLDTTELERRVEHRDQQSQADPMRPGAWMGSNLATQGYCLSDEERRELRWRCASRPVCASRWSSSRWRSSRP
jgi:hypothetical protein